MTIDEDDLEMDEDMSLYQGQPFTGVVQAFHSNGMLRKVANFLNGFKQGQCREWYSSGLLKREWNAVHGLVNGKLSEWHENGQYKTVAVYSKGVELLSDAWDEKGLHVMHFEIDPHSALAKYANDPEPKCP